jgi:hypothetical protein
MELNLFWILDCGFWIAHLELEILDFARLPRLSESDGGQGLRYSGFEK